MFLVLWSSHLPFWSLLHPSHPSPLHSLWPAGTGSSVLPATPTRVAVPVQSYACIPLFLSSLAPPPLPPFSSPSPLQQYNRQQIFYAQMTQLTFQLPSRIKNVQWSLPTFMYIWPELGDVEYFEICTKGVDWDCIRQREATSDTATMKMEWFVIFVWSFYVLSQYFFVKL